MYWTNIIAPSLILTMPEYCTGAAAIDREDGETLIAIGLLA
jgi:hypothetical protein